MEKKWQKFIAFEWLIFVIIGLFWAAAMSLPMYLSGELKEKGLWGRNFLILFGPYLAYVVVRIIFLLCCSLRWAYLVSNFLFRSEMERKFANEWGFFVLLFVFWSIIVACLAYYVGRFIPLSRSLAGLIMAVPYFLYVFIRFVGMSLHWSVRVLKEK